MSIICISGPFDYFLLSIFTFGCYLFIYSLYSRAFQYSTQLLSLKILCVCVHLECGREGRHLAFVGSTGTAVGGVCEVGSEQTSVIVFYLWQEF